MYKIYNDISDQLPIAVQMAAEITFNNHYNISKSRSYDQISASSFNIALSNCHIWNDSNDLCQNQIDPNSAYDHLKISTSQLFMNTFHKKLEKPPSLEHDKRWITEGTS